MRKSKDEIVQTVPEWWDSNADFDKWSDKGRSLYLGKYFYEIVRLEGRLELYGPLRGIYYSTQQDSSDPESFVQVSNSKVVALFEANQILVTDKLL